MTTPSEAAAETPNGNDGAAAAAAGGGTPGAAGSVEGGQPAAAPAAAAAAKPAEQDARYGAPEAGYKVPEGAQFEQNLVDGLEQLGKDLNLSQGGMDKVYALAQQYAVGMEKTFRNAHEANLKAWDEQVATDKELGGEALKANQATANAGLDAFGTPELKALLQESGLDRHPEIFRFAFRIGTAVAEDKFVRGGSQNSGQPGVFSYDKSKHA